MMTEHHSEIFEQEKVDNIIQVVLVIINKHLPFEIEKIKNPSRKRELVLPRQIAMALVRESWGTIIPYRMIGIYFGGRNHATVMHAKDVITDLCDTNKKSNLLIEKIRTEVNQYKNDGIYHEGSDGQVKDGTRQANEGECGFGDEQSDQPCIGDK